MASANQLKIPATRLDVSCPALKKSPTAKSSNILLTGSSAFSILSAQATAEFSILANALFQAASYSAAALVISSVKSIVLPPPPLEPLLELVSSCNLFISSNPIRDNVAFLAESATSW